MDIICDMVYIVISRHVVIYDVCLPAQPLRNLLAGLLRGHGARQAHVAEGHREPRDPERPPKVD